MKGYMQYSSVLNYLLNNNLPLINLGIYIQNIRGIDYVPTEMIQDQMEPQDFREMQCHVTTLIPDTFWEEMADFDQFEDWQILEWERENGMREWEDEGNQKCNRGNLQRWSAVYIFQSRNWRGWLIWTF